MDVVGLIIDKLGLGAGLVFGFLIILWLTSKAIVKRLFDEHNGIITIVATEHVSAMRKISDTQLEQRIDSIEVKKNLTELLLLLKDGNNNLSNQKIHACALVACDILEDITSEIDVDITEKLRQIRGILSRDGE